MDLFFLYIDEKNNLVNATKQTLTITTIDKDKLVDIIQNNTNSYSLKTLLKFDNANEPKLTEINTKKDVTFNTDILNTIYFVYKKKLKHSTTRKVFFTSPHRKTKRKALKASFT